MAAAGETRVEAPLAATLASPLPDPLEVGAGVALFCAGTCDPAVEPGSLELELGPARAAVSHAGIAAPGAGGAGDRWWALLDVPAAAAGAGRADLVLRGRLAGREVATRLASAEIVGVDPALAPLPPSVVAGPGPLIAVCLATYEPEPAALRTQIESIREQDWPDWVCMISDDCSSPGAFEAIAELTADDPRFTVSRSPRRLGFYRNFERALRMAPLEAGFVALADQDDRWYPDKLTALHATLGSDRRSLLAYSDMRIVDGGGRVLSDTYFFMRRNSYDSLASMLVANTVTGASALFRRELLETALPFPPLAGDPYHDHWLALCALALGPLRFLDRPTYDRLRHGGSVTGETRHAQLLEDASAQGPRALRRRNRLRRLVRRLRDWGGWRSAYFERYLPLAQAARTLELRCGERLAPPQRRRLARMIAAERSPAAAVALAARSLRPLVGRNETLGREWVLAGGLAWAWIAGMTATARRRRGQPG